MIGEPEAGKRGRPTKTHCLRGHSFTEENTLYRGVKRNKVCRLCEAIRRRQRLYRHWEETGP